MQIACAHCRYFAVNEPSRVTGECRRYAPSTQKPYDGIRVNFDSGVWTTVLPTEWCGEFRPRFDPAMWRPDRTRSSAT